MARRISKAHLARKALFRKGIQRGWLTLDEIDLALPAGALSPNERWLFYYSLRAAEVEIRGAGRPADADSSAAPV
jgi:hypothetical protein